MAPLEDAAEGEEIRIEEAEDVEPLKMAKDPKLPSAADVEIHERMHVPYRDWCKWCNLSRGRGMALKHSRGSAVPIVGVDYFFITGDGTMKRNELSFDKTPEGEEELRSARSKGEVIKCLIIRCFNSKNLFSHVVPVKGADDEDFAAKPDHGCGAMARPPRDHHAR